MQKLNAIAALLRRWDGKMCDNDVLPGLGCLLADIAVELGDLDSAECEDSYT